MWINLWAFKGSNQSEKKKKNLMPRGNVLLRCKGSQAKKGTSAF